MKFIATVCCVAFLSSAAPFAQAETYIILSQARGDDGRPLPIMITVDTVGDQMGDQPRYEGEVTQPRNLPVFVPPSPTPRGPPSSSAATATNGGSPLPHLVSTRPTAIPNGPPPATSSPTSSAANPQPTNGSVAAPPHNGASNHN